MRGGGTLGQSYLTSFDVPTDLSWKWGGVGYFLGLIALLLVLNVVLFATKRSESNIGSARTNEEEAPAEAPASAPAAIPPIQETAVASSSASSHVAVAVAPEPSEAAVAGAAAAPATAIPFEPASVAFRDITYTVQLPRGRGERVLLHGVSGCALPGRMLALMGASGAGASDDGRVGLGLLTPGDGEVSRRASLVSSPWRSLIMHPPLYSPRPCVSFLPMMQGRRRSSTSSPAARTRGAWRGKSSSRAAPRMPRPSTDSRPTASSRCAAEAEAAGVHSTQISMIITPLYTPLALIRLQDIHASLATVRASSAPQPPALLTLSYTSYSPSSSSNTGARGTRILGTPSPYRKWHHSGEACGSRRRGPAFAGARAPSGPPREAAAMEARGGGAARAFHLLLLGRLASPALRMRSRQGSSSASPSPSSSARTCPSSFSTSLRAVRSRMRERRIGVTLRTPF